MRWPRVAVRHVSQVFHPVRAVLLFARRAGSRHLPAHRSARRVLHRRRPRRRPMGIPINRQARRHGYHTLSGSAACICRWPGGERAFGVLALLPQNPRRVTPAGAVSLARDFSRPQIGLALERADFAAHAQAAEVRGRDPKPFAMRCWRRSRMICARRWPPSPVAPRRSPAISMR